MKRFLPHVAIFIAGLAIGALAALALTRPPQSKSEQEWQLTFSEEGGHERILGYQRALAKSVREDAAKNVDTLSKQVEAQLKIEDLIVKTREAEYAKFTPFNAISVALVGVLSSFLTWLVTTKKRPRDNSNP